MEVEQVLFQSAQDQGVICAALKSTLDLFADDEILGIENGSVDELERALPVRPGILVRRFLRDQHRMHPDCDGPATAPSEQPSQPWHLVSALRSDKLAKPRTLLASDAHLRRSAVVIGADLMSSCNQYVH
jgi:hypothetical protein